MCYLSEFFGKGHATNIIFCFYFFYQSDISFKDGSEQLIRAVFIRAPWVEKVSDSVQVLASVDSHPVAVRSKTALATSFHPELTGDHRIHRYFIEQVARPALQKVK